MISLIDRIWFLLKKVIILMVIFFMIWGVYQLSTREEERDLQPNNNYEYEDQFMQQ
jgi:protein-S-isoprenylcysteine O-methyltransferase Ste14